MRLRNGIQFLLHRFFGLHAHDCLYRLAAFEEDERGDAHDAVLPGGFDIFINIQFDDFYFAFVFARQFFYDWEHGFAGSAPACPEVYEYGNIGLEDFLLEFCVGDCLRHGEWGKGCFMHSVR